MGAGREARSALPWPRVCQAASGRVVRTNHWRECALGSVFGCGYLGVTHAACMAELGHDVVGVDVDLREITLLSNGQVAFYEPALQELVDRHVRSGNLRFTTFGADDARNARIHFICVGTPQRGGSNAADTRYVDAVIGELAPQLTAGSLVVGKSTIRLATATRLAAQLRKLSPPGQDVALAWSPEFLREGHSVHDTLNPDRLVLGVSDAWAERLLREIYAPLMSNGVPLVVTDLPTAELIKYGANAFLATKISFINALAELCEATGADVTVIAEVLAYDARIGSQFLAPGLGFGGGCLSKDIRALHACARELGVGDAVSFLSDVDHINMRRRARTVDLIAQKVGWAMSGRRIAILGAPFKPDSDDVRDSPALHVANDIQQAGGDVVIYDPRAMANARRVYPALAYARTVWDACRGADVVALLTEWPEFRDISTDELGKVVSERHIVDARNALSAADWLRVGWSYTALGRPPAAGADGVTGAQGASCASRRPVAGRR